MDPTDTVVSTKAARRAGVVVLGLLALFSVAGIYWLTAAGGGSWVAETIKALDALVKSNFTIALVVFLLLSLVLQLLVLPTGTITMLTGGFIFGAPIAAGLYYLAQLAAAPMVFGAARLGFGRFADDKIAGLVRRDTSGRLASILEIARSEGVLAAVALRLAPVITSPVVPILAAMAGMKLRALMIGSVLVSWVRPLFWASVGATLSNVAQITNPSEIVQKISLTPILLAFAAAALLFVARIYLKARTAKRAG